MIYDCLANIENYRGISSHLDTAIQFITSNDLQTLPLGRTEIDGDNVFVNVMEAYTKPANELLFETHTQYLDIQIDLDGSELLEVALDHLEETTPYCSERDIAFYKAAPSSACALDRSKFIIFMTEEAHKPCIGAVSETPIKKCVFKVAKS
jgi:YhcH/YjgK/YiaL family protein